MISGTLVKILGIMLLIVVAVLLILGIGSTIDDEIVVGVMSVS